VEDKMLAKEPMHRSFSAGRRSWRMRRHATMIV
jgi:hypothetical protein